MAHQMLASGEMAHLVSQSFGDANFHEFSETYQIVAFIYTDYKNNHFHYSADIDPCQHNSFIGIQPGKVILKDSIDQRMINCLNFKTLQL